MLGSNGQVTSADTHASVSYLEGFLENADSLPAELQYYVTLYKEVSCFVKETSGEISRYNDMVVKSSDISQKKQAVHHVQRCLIKQKELGDQKLEILAMMVELVENKTRELEVDQQHPETSLIGNSNGAKEDEVSLSSNQNKSSADNATVLSTRSSNNSNNNCSNNINVKNEDKMDVIKTKRHRRHRGSVHQDPVAVKEEEKKQQLEEEERPKKKKTRKDKTVERLSSGVKIIGNIDPNEPVYCHCRQVSYGEMIGCDNESCTIEWFHFHCVSLTHKPKGKWFCPSCRGDRQNILNPELAEQQRRAKKNAAATISNSVD